MKFVTRLNNSFDIRRGVPEDLRPLVCVDGVREQMREMRECAG